MNPALYGVIAAIGSLGVLMSIYLGGSSNTTFSFQEKPNVLASDILNDFAATKNAVSSMQMTAVNPTDVVYNGAPIWDSVATSPSAINDAHANAKRQVFSSVYGLMEPRKANTEIFTSTTEADRRVYMYRRARVTNVGSTIDVGTSTADVVMLAVEVSLDVCRHLNRNVAGDSLTQALTASGLAGGPGATGTPQLTDAGTSIGTITVPSSAGSPRLSGCVSTTAGQNIAYQVLVTN